MTALVYSPAEVATLLRRSRRTVYELLRTGELPAVKVRGTWAVRKVDLEQFLTPSGAGSGVGFPVDPNNPTKSAA